MIQLNIIQYNTIQHLQCWLFSTNSQRSEREAITRELRPYSYVVFLSQKYSSSFLSSSIFMLAVQSRLEPIIYKVRDWGKSWRNEQWSFLFALPTHSTYFTTDMVKDIKNSSKIENLDLSNLFSQNHLLDEISGKTEVTGLKVFI